MTRGTGRGRKRPQPPRSGESAPKTGKDRIAAPRRGKTATAKPSPLTWADARCEATGTGWLFVVPVVESANRVWRAAKGRTYKSAKARGDAEAAALKFGRIAPLTGPVVVRIVWVRQRKAGDLDNKAKASLDLLKGIAYGDDAAVVELHMVRVDDGSPARLEITVEPAQGRQEAA